MENRNRESGKERKKEKWKKVAIERRTGKFDLEWIVSRIASNRAINLPYVALQ